jgi:hypothetical protein
LRSRLAASPQFDQRLEYSIGSVDSKLMGAQLVWQFIEVTTRGNLA